MALEAPAARGLGELTVRGCCCLGHSLCFETRRSNSMQCPGCSQLHARVQCPVLTWENPLHASM